MKKILWTQEAYIEGCDGAFLREIDKDGNDLATGIWGTWYTSQAVDEENNEYQVFWKILDSFDPEEDDDESCACDWEKPWMVLDKDGKNVVASVRIA